MRILKNKIFLLLFIAAPILLACTCNHAKKVVDQPNEIINDEIIVHLKGKVSPKTLIGAYQNYKLQIIRSINEEANQWLITWDTDLIEPAEMLKTLKNSQFTTDAAYFRKQE